MAATVARTPSTRADVSGVGPTIECVRIGPSSLRSRLALLFALGTGALLLLSAGLLYFTLEAALDDAIDDGLRARADDVASLVSADRGIPPAEVFAQLLGADGTVVAASDGAATEVVVVDGATVSSLDELPRAVERPVPGLGRRARLVIKPLRTPGAARFVVVGSSLDESDRARRHLGLGLGLGSPVLLTVLAGAGWLLAGAALRPVAAMTTEAGAISSVQPGPRLPEPAGDDEIARLGRTLNDMLARIETAFAHERAFVDHASHELRTPVAILQAELELALASPGDRSAVEATLRSALDEVERLGDLASDLLVLARAQAGGIPIDRVRTDVAAMAKRLSTQVVATVDPSRAVVVAVEPSSAVAAVDPLRFEQILVNLLANAVGHAATSVEVCFTAGDDGAVTLRVADDGPGFPDDFLPVAFDRFTRADAARGRSTGGTGLGLSIVAGLAEAHGGTAQAANGPPLGGAVVSVALPGDAADVERSPRPAG